MMLVDIKHMKYFIEVVKQGGMTNASKSLYILHNLQLVKQLKILKMKWARPYLIEVKDI